VHILNTIIKIQIRKQRIKDSLLNLYLYALAKSFKWHHVCLNPALEFKSYKKSFHFCPHEFYMNQTSISDPMGSGCRVYNVCKMDYTDCNFHVKLFCVCMFDSKWGMLSLKTTVYAVGWFLVLQFCMPSMRFGQNYCHFCTNKYGNVELRLEWQQSELKETLASLYYLWMCIQNVCVCVCVCAFHSLGVLQKSHLISFMRRLFVAIWSPLTYINSNYD